MRKPLIQAFAVLAVAFLMAGILLAESFSFELYKEATVGGTLLPAGEYRLKLNDGEAKIYRGTKLMVQAKVEVGPSESGVRPNTLIIERGKLLEIRRKKQVVVFID